MSVLDEAKAVVEDRMERYGHPIINFKAIADCWNAILQVKTGIEDILSPSDVALMMIQTKIMREVHQSNRDNWVDMAGYVNAGHLTLQDADSV